MDPEFELVWKGQRFYIFRGAVWIPILFQNWLIWTTVGEWLIKESDKQKSDDDWFQREKNPTFKPQSATPKDI